MRCCGHHSDPGGGGARGPFAAGSCRVVGVVKVVRECIRASMGKASVSDTQSRTTDGHLRLVLVCLGRGVGDLSPGGRMHA
jgi:hypothetical protein